MSKNGKKRTWNMRLLAFALTMILAISPLVSGTYAEASSVQTLDVGEYKGDRAVSEWIVPTETGKVFAGWYTDDTFSTVYTETDGNAVAKFVDAKVLTVKKQLPSTAKSTDTTMNIRFLTAIDSLKFKGVSFDIKVPESGKEWTNITEKVAYSSMLAEENGSSTEKFAKDEFGTEDAQFFVAHSLKGIPNAAFGHTITVTPSWVTMDGTTVTGEELNFTINEALLEGSLFAGKVTIGERTEESAVQAWDISDIANNTITGTDLTDGQVMWFKATGSDAVAQMTVTRKDTTGTRCGQPLAGIGISDGTSYGHVGVRAGGVIYNGNWITGKIGKDVLATWSSADNLSIELEIILHDGEFSVYVDGVYATSIDVAQVITGATADTNLAFSVVMSAFNEGTTEFEFSNIRFATGESAVENFFLAKAGFANQVTVNGAIVTSDVDNWAFSAADNSMTGTHTTTSTFYLAPTYFAETGSIMLLKTTIENVSETKAGQPMAGLYVTDGTNKGHFGLCAEGLVYGPWNTWVTEKIGYAVLASWGNQSVGLEVVLKDEVFAIYVDGIFFMNLPFATVLPNTAAGTELAYGLTMRSDSSTYATKMKFSNLTFTTDSDAIENFLLEKAGFANTVSVNGTTVTSDVDNWAYSAADNSMTGTHTTTSTFYLTPTYFAETGSTMLLQTTITNNSETIKGQPMAGVYVTDGTNKGHFGLCGNGLVYGPWNSWVTETRNYAVLSQWSSSTSAKLEVALKDGVFAIYVDDVFYMNLGFSTVLPNTTAGTELAYGLTMRTDSNDYPATMKFSNITFTTDATAVDTFLASKTTTE